MIRKTTIYLFLLAAGFRSAFSQEIITGLQSDYNIMSAAKNSTKGLAAFDTAELPFFDDFSGNLFSPTKKNGQIILHSSTIPTQKTRSPQALQRSTL